MFSKQWPNKSMICCQTAGPEVVPTTACIFSFAFGIRWHRRHALAHVTWGQTSGKPMKKTMASSDFLEHCSLVAFVATLVATRVAAFWATFVVTLVVAFVVAFVVALVIAWLQGPFFFHEFVFFPQQRKLNGSSAQINPGVCRSGSQEQVPEEGSGRFRRVPCGVFGEGGSGRFGRSGVGSGFRFQKVPKG